MGSPETISNDHLNIWVDATYSIIGTKAIKGIVFNENNGYPEGSPQTYCGNLSCYTKSGRMSIYAGVFRGHVARHGPFYEIESDSLPVCPFLLSSHPCLEGPCLFRADVELPTDIGRDLEKGYLPELAVASEHAFGILFGGPLFPLVALFSSNVSGISECLGFELPEWGCVAMTRRLHIVGGTDRCWRVLLRYSREKVASQMGGSHRLQ